MRSKFDIDSSTKLNITLQDVNRVLEAGQLLLSVLTEEELKDLKFLSQTENQLEMDSEIGNAGVT